MPWESHKRLSAQPVGAYHSSDEGEESLWNSSVNNVANLTVDMHTLLVKLCNLYISLIGFGQLFILFN